jgi:hypothetical protein
LLLSGVHGEADQQDTQWNGVSCCALFDRAPIPLAETNRLTGLDQDWFWKIAEPYGVGLAP